jgi:hypothetical protein
VKIEGATQPLRHLFAVGKGGHRCIREAIVEIALIDIRRLYPVPNESRPSDGLVVGVGVARERSRIRGCQLGLIRGGRS